MTSLITVFLVNLFGRDRQRCDGNWGKTVFLIARLHALPNASGDVLRLSQSADEAVKVSEPGMLRHTFDQEPSDPRGFVWTEVYANSAALIFDLENPPLQKYLADVSPLLDTFTVELCGEVST